MAPRGLKSAPLDMKNVELWRSGLPSHHGIKTTSSETLGSDYPETFSPLSADLKTTRDLKYPEEKATAVNVRPFC